MERWSIPEEIRMGAARGRVEHRISYSPRTGRLVYANRVSSRDRGRSYPEGFLKVKSLQVDEREQRQILELLYRNVDRLPMRFWLPRLPAGVSFDAWLAVRRPRQRDRFYSDIRVGKDGVSLRRGAVPASFWSIFDELEGLCDFPTLGPKPAVIRYPKDPRYREETLWLCKRCHAGNLFAYPYCFNCGLLRGWSPYTPPTPVRAEAFWLCRRCGTRNPAGRKTCVTCAAPRAR